MKYNIVDSSAWLEYFVEGQNAAVFAPIIQDTAHLIVPTIIVHEVFKSILRHRTESEALYHVDYLLQGKLIELTLSLSLEAAKYGILHKLPMADSLIYATACQYKAIIWTQDADFKDLPQVQYYSKH